MPQHRHHHLLAFGGVLARWLSRRNWMLELGWALGQGLYAKVQFQF